MTSRTQRVVFTPHAWSFWAYPAFLPIERLAAHWCRAIVCVSDHERAAGLDARVGVRQQYAVIPNGVDLDRFAPAAGAGAARTAGAAPPDGDRLVMVGRLANQRRHDLALRALAALRARHRPGATLELVGDGPLRPSLEQLASELGIADAVSFLGERSDVPDRLRAASVVIHATRYEGASLGVIEAMASGRPVVASGVGGMDELVDAGVTGYLCGEDPHEWADLIDRALAMRVAMGQAARARAEARFSLAGMTASTLDLYNRVAHAQWEPGSTFHG
jgi:glycosyltransferase involved in cell wall biosynthesis